MPNLQDAVIIDIPSGNCAVCRNSDGLVVNTIVANPDDPNPFSDSYLIGIELNTPVTVGCRWDGSRFLDAEGNPVVPTVPETHCAIVDSNSYVSNLAYAQINEPYLYGDSTLIPIPEGETVEVGYFWTGTEFIDPNKRVINNG